MLPKRKKIGLVFLGLFCLLGVLLLRNIYLIGHYGVFLNKPVSLMKKGTYEFNYRQLFGGGYSVWLYIQSTQKWSQRQSQEEGTKIRLAILDSLTFKLEVRLYQNNHEIKHEIISYPREKWAAFLEEGPLFQLLMYYTTNQKPEDFKLVLNVLEPETSPFYKDARIQVYPSMSKNGIYFSYLAILSGIGMVISGSVALFSLCSGKTTPK